jgi:hypothetical protein
LYAVHEELKGVRNKRSRVETNMALAQTDEQFRAMAKLFEGFRGQERDLEKKIANLEATQERRATCIPP